MAKYFYDPDTRTIKVHKDGKHFVIAVLKRSKEELLRYLRLTCDLSPYLSGPESINNPYWTCVDDLDEPPILCILPAIIPYTNFYYDFTCKTYEEEFAVLNKFWEDRKSRARKVRRLCKLHRENENYNPNVEAFRGANVELIDQIGSYKIFSFNNGVNVILNEKTVEMLYLCTKYAQGILSLKLVDAILLLDPLFFAQQQLWAEKLALLKFVYGMAVHAQARWRS